MHNRVAVPIYSFKHVVSLTHLVAYYTVIFVC